MMFRKRFVLLMFPLLGLLFLAGGAQGGIIYVDEAATGADDGSTWGDAYPLLQDALSAAGAGDEIWVAAGTYMPGSLTSDTFTLADSVALYGGFIGDETSLYQRNWGDNISSIGGDLPGSIYNLVTASSIGSATLDGFKIAYAAQSGSGCQGGAGVRLLDSDLWIANCTFYHNSTTQEGGALYNYLGTCFVEDCTFELNKATVSGGAILNEQGQMSVSGCRFSNNGGTYYSVGTGGGCEIQMERSA